MNHFLFRIFLLLSTLSWSESFTPRAIASYCQTHQPSSTQELNALAELSLPFSPCTNRLVLKQSKQVEFYSARRHTLHCILAGVSLAFIGSSPLLNSKANALDMDAFVNSQLTSDTTNCNSKTDPKCKPKLSEDEALCKYGQSGNARAEACKRVKSQGGELPQPSLQGKGPGGAYAL